MSKQFRFLLFFICGLLVIGTQAQNKLDKAGLSNDVATTAYSLRQLSSTYTGPLVRINIGGTGYDVWPEAFNGIISTSSIISSANPSGTPGSKNGTTTLGSILNGSTNASVSIWYDQSGSGYNLTQSNSGSQPSLISNGSINTVSGSGRPSLYFGAANLATVKATLFPSGTWMSGVAKGNSGTSSSFVTKSGTSSGSNTNYPSPFDFTNSSGMLYAGSAASQSLSGIGLNTTNPRSDISSAVAASVYSFVLNPGQGMYSFLNGSNIGGAGLGSGVYFDGGNAMMVGNRNDGGGSGNFWTPELILFNNNTTSSANLQTLVSNQKGYFFNYQITITGQPAATAQSVVQDGSATALSVSASNATSYQWYANTTASNTGGTLISGATNANYTPSTSTAGTLYYYCVVSNGYNNVASNVSGAVKVTANSTITGVSASQTIVYGTATIILSGSINAGSTSVPNGETVSVSINGATSTTTTTGGNGAFSVSFNTSTILYSATPYTITYAYAGNALINAASNNTTTTLTVTKVTPTIGTLSLPAVNNADAPFTITNPTSNSSGAFTYSSSNTAVATVSGNTVTIVAAGTATITATQAASGIYTSGTAAATLTVTTLNKPGKFSYTTPSSFTVGTAIASLTPQIVPEGTVTTLGSGFNTANGLTVDANGTVYVADTYNQVVKKIATDGTITTIATGFNNPYGLAQDAAGNIYVADRYNHALKKIAINGTVSTLKDMTSLNLSPVGIVVDAAGTTIYFTESTNNTLQKFANGTLTTIVGTGNFTRPFALALDGSGNFYVADNGSHAILKVASNGTITTLASGINFLTGITVDAAGNVYYVNSAYQAEVKKIDKYGVTTTVAKGFDWATALSIDAAGNLYVGNANVSAIAAAPGAVSSYSISPSLPSGLVFNTTSGVITGTPTRYSAATNYTVTATNLSGTATATINIGVACGANATSTTNKDVATASYVWNGTTYTTGGTYTKTFVAGSSAGCDSVATLHLNFIAPGNFSYTTPNTFSIGTSIAPLSPKAAAVAGTVSSIGTGFNYPYGVAVDTKGNVYVADNGNNAIKKIATDGTVTTLGGGFNRPASVAVDASGIVYVADYLGNALKKIATDGTVTTLIDFKPHNFGNPRGVAVDAAGIVYCTDAENNRIYTYNNGVIAYGQFNFNTSTIAIDAVGNKYVSSTNGIVRKIATNGNISIIASGLLAGGGVAVDAAGNIYYSDGGGVNVGITKLATDGSTSTLGSGFLYPSDIAFDADGNIYVADQGNNAVKKISTAGGGAVTNYSISPALPTGLSIDANTGTISGTPTVVSAAKNYTVTATNAGGTATSILSIVVNCVPTSSSTTHSACGSYTWNGTTYTTSGTYTKTGLTNATGCDSTATLVLTIIANAPTIGTLSLPSVSTQSAPFTLTAPTSNSTGVFTYTSSNTSVATVSGSTLTIIGAGTATITASQAANGCYASGSVSATLTVVPCVTTYTPSDIEVSSVIFSGTYKPNGTHNGVQQWYRAQNNFYLRWTGSSWNVMQSEIIDGDLIEQVIYSSNDGSATYFPTTGWSNHPYFGTPTFSGGVGNIGNISLVNPTISGTTTGCDNVTLTATGGNSYSWTGGNTPTTAANTFATSGSYTVTATNAIGCTGTATANVTVNKPSAGTSTVSNCGSYVWNGTTYTTSGTYTKTLVNAGGCDSTATLVLTINQPSTSTTNVTSNTSSYVWNGTTYTTPGTYTKTFVGGNSTGCDSVATLQLSFAPPSQFSYTTPNTFNQFTAISPLTPIVSNTPTVVASGLSMPYNQAVDANGNVYVADGSLTLKKIAPNGMVSEILVNDIMSPTISAVTVDGRDNLFVIAQIGSNYIFKLAQDGSYTIIGLIGDDFYTDIEADAYGNLFVVDFYNGVIKFAANGSKSYIGSGIRRPKGVGVDATGNVYVTNRFGSLYKIDLAGNTTTIASGLKNPTDVVVDASGNIYVAESGGGDGDTNGTIKKIAPDGSISIIYNSTSFGVRAGLAKDKNGAVYFNEDYNGIIYKITPTVLATNYSIAPALPTGLSIDANTGIISGTPSVPSAVATYTVSGSNAGGSASTTLDITVISSCVPTTSSTTESACGSYTWNGTTYTTSGTYTKTLVNAGGCDSTATLELTINQPTTSSTTASNCGSYVWNGTTYSTSGTYTKTLVNAGGCDSTATLVLTITPCTNTWTGVTSTDWNTASNWSSAVVPTASTDAIIANTARKPVISGTANVKNLTIGIGASLTVSGTLNVSGNWVNNGVPALTGNGTVVLQSSSAATLSGYTLFNNLEVAGNHSVGPLAADNILVDSIAVTGILKKTSGTLTTNGKVTLKSTASKTALIQENGGALTGKINVERYIGGASGYHHISSPVTNNTVGNWGKYFSITGVNNIAASAAGIGKIATLQEYRESANKKSILDSGFYQFTLPSAVTTSGKGFTAWFIKSTTTLVSTGTPANGNINVPVTFAGTNATTKGWNLIGNPYPSPISWSALRSSNPGVWGDQACYIWKATNGVNGQWQTYNGTVGTNGVGNVIASSQAFFVLVNQSTNLTFNNSIRTTDVNPTFFGTAQLKQLRLQIVNPANLAETDEVVAYTKAGIATPVASVKPPMPAEATNASLSFVYEGKQAAIEAVADFKAGDELALNISTPIAGVYLLKVGEYNNSLPAYLKDAKTGSFTELKAGTEIAVATEATTSNTRYSVVFGRPAAAVAAANNTFKVFAAKKAIQVTNAVAVSNAKVVLYNTLGQQIATATMNGTSLTIPLNAQTNATYLVKIAGETVAKVIVP